MRRRRSIVERRVRELLRRGRQERPRRPPKPVKPPRVPKPRKKILSTPYARKFRQDAIAAGLCPCGQRAPVEGKKHCQPCLDRMKCRRATLAAAGRCSCGKPAAPDHKSCQRCLTRRSRRTPESKGAAAKRSATLREERRAAGLCGCGASPEPGKKCCAACLQRATKRRARTGHAEKNRAAAKKTREKHLGAGLCPCGKPRRKRRYSCDDCLEANRARYRRDRGLPEPPRYRDPMTGAVLELSRTFPNGKAKLRVLEPGKGRAERGDRVLLLLASLVPLTAARPAAAA